MNASTIHGCQSHVNLKRPAPLGIFALILACFAVLSMTGCLGLTGAGTPAAKSGSPSGSNTGTLTASSMSLSFGNVTAGTSSPLTLTLTNTGTGAVTISQATVTGAGFSVVGEMSTVSIAGGQNHAFQVQFAPTTTGSVTGGISIVSDATDSPLAVSLSGTGMAGLAITAQPESQSVTAGQTATFSVKATGTGTITYQWKKGGVAINGATAASYTTPVTTSASNGAEFAVVVTDGVESMTSSNAILTVTSAAVAPTITTQPTSKNVTSGQAATFSVAATGTAPLSYQWKMNGADISGATSASYTIPTTVASENDYKFTVTVSNSVSNVASNAATLTVDVPPSIVTQPANRAVNAGQTATFSVVAAGTGILSYQWKRDGIAISGATAASYTTPATATSDNGAQFTVLVTDVVSSVTSSAATLTVNGPPSIVTQPSSKTVAAGQVATFSVNATGTGNLTYQWNNGGAAINGANSSSYTTPATTTADSGAQFTVTVSNGVGSVTSNAATLTVSAAATLILNANKASLNFSNVNIGSNSMLPVIFTNSGNSDVTISNVTISGAGYTANGISSGQIVKAGLTATLDVTFTPSSAGALPGSVSVSSNATNSPAAVTLSGAGVQPSVSHSVTLNWTASTPAVPGYNVYRSTVSGGPYTLLNSTLILGTTYADTAVQTALTYYYVVTSVDSSGVESAYSSEVSALVP